MTLVLDAGVLSALASDPARLTALLRRRSAWPAVVPATVVAQAMTGDPSRDRRLGRLLQACVLCPVDETVAWEAARLMTVSGRGGPVAAAQATVAAVATVTPGAVVVTTEPDDLNRLADRAAWPIAVTGL